MSKLLKIERKHSFNDETSIKCGEIMFSNNTKFSFSCTFCKKNCEKIQEFYRHVLYDHLNYLEEYKFDEDDECFSEKILNQSRSMSEKTEFVDVDIEDAKETKNGIDFSNHFEEFVCQSIPASVSIKSEVDDDEDEEEDYKDDIEEFEFFLENEHLPTASKRVQSPTPKSSLNNILHIEFLEEPTANEFEPEHSDIIEFDSLKNDSQEDEYNDEYDELLNNNATDKFSSASEDEEPSLIITRSDDTKENHYKCPYPDCKKSFITKNGARRHIQNIHKEHKNHATCETCFKKFKNQNLLEKHNMLRHLGYKPHECEICGTCFSDKSNLNVHIMRHKGIRPHACSLCQKRFHSSTELKLHTRSHTGERPFICELCGRKFSNSGHLCNHRRRHLGEKRFQCDVCKKRFFDRKLLNDHKVMHTDERPFECFTCGATFQRKKALLQHEKLHLDVKQYVCKLCGKSFAQNAGLYSHMKGHKVNERICLTK